MSNEKNQTNYRIKSARATWHDYSGGAYFVTVCTKTREHSFGKILVETGRAPSLYCVQEKTGHAPSLQGLGCCLLEKTGHAPSLQTPTVQLSKIGQFLFDNLQNITTHYPYAEIPLFVVMPNHWHAIVFIDGDKTPYVRGNSNVETGRAPSIPEHSPKTGRAPSIPEQNIKTGHAPSIQGLGCCLNEKTGHAPSLQPETTTNEKMQKIDSCKGWLSVVIGGIKSAVTKFSNENGIHFAWQTRFHDNIIRNQNDMNRIANYIENNPATWDTDCFNDNNNPK